MTDVKVWTKDKYWKYVPVSKRYYHILANPYGNLYLYNGEKIRGIEHPTGAIIAQRIMYDKVRTH